MMTLGIFSTKLINKLVSKEVIAYLPNFDVLYSTTIMHHLTSICGLSTNNAKNEIKYFKMKLKNIFWGKLLYSHGIEDVIYTY